jgi:taurine dioxygenase
MGSGASWTGSGLPSTFSAMNVAITPIGGPIGVELHGLDLSRDPAFDVICTITAALRDHLLLLVRSQELTRERLAEIASWFGELHRPRADVPALGDHSLDPIVIVSNVDERGLLGSAAVPSHADQEYLAEPSRATLLYAAEVPVSGGETSWLDLRRAYDDLPGRLKRRLDGLERWTANPYAGVDPGDPTARESNQRFSEAKYPPALHPLVRVQAGSGRRALYVSSLTTGLRGIRGPAAAWRSRKLLRRLKRHVAQPHRLYAHHWHPGDLVVWDNSFTIHRRAAFDGSQRRVMYRCQVEHEAPLGSEAP